MKKTIFIALLTIFSLSATSAFAAETNSTATTATAPAATTNKLTEEEISTYRARVEEIRDMDNEHDSKRKKGT